MKLHYIWDAYCGWCYGFGAPLNEFTGNHPELDISITSGGLFVEDRIQQVSQFGFMKAGNEQIKAIYGSEFSDAYNDLLDEGSTIINSNHPATALSVLKKYVAPERLIEFAHAMQKQFFIQGKSLSDIATYVDLFETFAIPAQAQNELQAQWQDYSLAEQDFQQARAWGVTSYPTLILEHSGKLYNLGQNAHSAEALEANYRPLTH